MKHDDRIDIVSVIVSEFGLWPPGLKPMINRIVEVWEVELSTTILEVENISEEFFAKIEREDDSNRL